MRYNNFENTERAYQRSTDDGSVDMRRHKYCELRSRSATANRFTNSQFANPTNSDPEAGANPDNKGFDKSSISSQKSAMEICRTTYSRHLLFVACALFLAGAGAAVGQGGGGGGVRGASQPVQDAATVAGRPQEGQRMAERNLWKSPKLYERLQLPGDCNGTLKFDEYAGGDYEEGDLTNYGERLIWSDNPLFDLEGGLVGSVTGMCTVVAMADPSQDALLLCNTYYTWTDGPFAKSTLVAEGMSHVGNATEYTILGGSGCFARASGVVDTQYVAGLDSYRTFIQFQ